MRFISASVWRRAQTRMRDPFSLTEWVVRRLLLPFTVAFELLVAFLVFIAGRAAFGLILLIVATVIMVVWIALPPAKTKR